MKDDENKQPMERSEDSSKGEKTIPAISDSGNDPPKNSIPPFRSLFLFSRILLLFASKVDALPTRLTNIICDKNFSYFGTEQTDPTGHFYATAAPILADGVGNGEQFLRRIRRIQCISMGFHPREWIRDPWLYISRTEILERWSIKMRSEKGINRNLVNE